MSRVIKYTGSTVKDLIEELLQKAPGDYSVSLSGMSEFDMVIDDENKVILLDDPKWIEENFAD